MSLRQDILNCYSSFGKNAISKISIPGEKYPNRYVDINLNTKVFGNLEGATISFRIFEDTSIFLTEDTMQDGSFNGLVDLIKVIYSWVEYDYKQEVSFNEILASVEGIGDGLKNLGLEPFGVYLTILESILSKFPFMCDSVPHIASDFSIEGNEITLYDYEVSGKKAKIALVDERFILYLLDYCEDRALKITFTSEYRGDEWVNVNNIITSHFQTSNRDILSVELV